MQALSDRPRATHRSMSLTIVARESVPAAVARASHSSWMKDSVRNPAGAEGPEARGPDSESPYPGSAPRSGDLATVPAGCLCRLPG